MVSTNLSLDSMMCPVQLAVALAAADVVPPAAV